MAVKQGLKWFICSFIPFSSLQWYGRWHNLAKNEVISFCYKFSSPKCIYAMNMSKKELKHVFIWILSIKVVWALISGSFILILNSLNTRSRIRWEGINQVITLVDSFIFRNFPIVFFTFNFFLISMYLVSHSSRRRHSRFYVH